MLLLLLALARVSQSASPIRPNILFIMSDDQGYQDAGFRGSNIPTPNMDRMAKKGVVLDYHYVMPQCSPTRQSFLSGKYPIRIGSWYGNIRPTEESGLPLGERTIADMLTENNYRTHAIGKWHAGMYSWEHTPVYRGFDTFTGMYQGSSDYFKHTNLKHYDFRYDYRRSDDSVHDEVLHEEKGKYSTRFYTDTTLDLLQQHKDSYGTGNQNPFFIYLAYQTPHGPYQVPRWYKDRLTGEDFEGSSGRRKTYAAMVTCMDHGIGRIERKLEALGLLDNTLIVFASDNGAIADGPGSNYPLRGGKKNFYEGGIRSLSFVSSPLLQKTGYVNTHLHHVTDWFATFEFLASGDKGRGKGYKKKFGRRQNDNYELDGRNIWKSISNNVACRDTVLVNIRRNDRYGTPDEENMSENDARSTLSDLDHRRIPRRRGDGGRGRSRIMGQGRSITRGGRSPGFGPEDNTFNSVSSTYDSDHTHRLGNRVRSAADNRYREFLNRHKSALDVEIMHELNSIEFQLEDGTEAIDEVDGQGDNKAETGTETIYEEFDNNSSENENETGTEVIDEVDGQGDNRAETGTETIDEEFDNNSSENENETRTEVIDEAPAVEIIDPIIRNDIQNEAPAVELADPAIEKDIQVNDAPEESKVIDPTEVTGEEEQSIEDNSVRGGDGDKDNQISETEDKEVEGSNEAEDADEEATVTSEKITEEPEESEVDSITDTQVENDTHTVEKDPEDGANEVEEDGTDEPLWDWENDMFGADSDRDEPFNDLVVFIWNSWKLIIGEENELLEPGWTSPNCSDHHFIISSDANTAVGSETLLLFELRTDPRERRNIAGRYPGMVREMIKRIRRNYLDHVIFIPKSNFSGKGKQKDGIWRPWVMNRSRLRYDY